MIEVIELAEGNKKRKKEILSQANKIVIKVGTSVLAGPEGRLKLDRVESIATQIGWLISQGKKCVLVTSGAIAAGVERLGLKSRPRSMPSLQAAASVGQSILMKHYDSYFSPLGIPVGQILLTQHDLVYRSSFLNARNTFNRLLELGVLPIVNENDATAVEEIRYGDNDALSAMVACSIEADLLIILTDRDGFFDREGNLIKEINEITPSLYEQAGGAGSTFSSGGMVTKLEAALMVSSAGIGMVIANGLKEDILKKVIEGKEGTFFYPKTRFLSGRKLWIAFVVPPRGRVTVDEGAKKALVEGHKSLLPVGIVKVEGKFEVNEVIEIADEEGQVFAKGITNFSSEEISRIKGKRCHEAACLLEGTISDEVVHRDALVILPMGGYHAKTGAGSRKES